MAGPIVPVEPDEEEQVWRWRYRRVRALGFDRFDAELLASNPNVDLHRLEALLNAGCSPKLAKRIVR